MSSAPPPLLVLAWILTYLVHSTVFLGGTLALCARAPRLPVRWQDRLWKLALVGGLLALVVRIQIAWPDHDFGLVSKILPRGFDEGVMKPEFYAALFTMHGTIMIFFVLSAALIGGFGNYVLPLQVGAKDMAFPRLNALSYWIYAAS